MDVAIPNQSLMSLSGRCAVTSLRELPTIRHGVPGMNDEPVLVTFALPHIPFWTEIWPSLGAVA